MNGDIFDASKLSLNTNTSPVENESSSPILSPVTTPPYWVQSHQRSFSNISIESIVAGAITLQDNEDGQDTKSKFCWAKSVHIEDHVVINERRTGIGAFVVWNITVETLRVNNSHIFGSTKRYADSIKGSSFRIRKRFSEFDDLRQKLLQTFPNSEGAMPPLPPKSVISKFRPRFLENRRVGLQYFLKFVLTFLLPPRHPPAVYHNGKMLTLMQLHPPKP